MNKPFERWIYEFMDQEPSLQEKGYSFEYPFHCCTHFSPLFLKMSISSYLSASQHFSQNLSISLRLQSLLDMIHPRLEKSSSPTFIISFDQHSVCKHEARVSLVCQKEAGGARLLLEVKSRHEISDS